MHPIIPSNKQALEKFREEFWDYYQRLLDYKANPSKQLSVELSEDFDLLFSQKTGYKKLDDQIELALSSLKCDNPTQFSSACFSKIFSR
ncbi:MAG: hypothetical protein GY820_46810 [Gammaproteobacteria bacterium]|nr:hypothetical protein [Gammaproteobacteria bacterium]